MCWILGHIEAWLAPEIEFPLALDVGVVCVGWYALGAFGRDFLKGKKALFVSIIVLVLYAISKIVGCPEQFSKYAFEINLHYYKDMILDIMIPMAFFVILLYVSGCICRKSRFVKKMFVEFGKYTIPIMALHSFIDHRVQRLLGFNNEIIYTIVGVIVPYLVAKVGFERLPERYKYLVM